MAKCGAEDFSRIEGEHRPDREIATPLAAGCSALTRRGRWGAMAKVHLLGVAVCLLIVEPVGTSLVGCMPIGHERAQRLKTQHGATSPGGEVSGRVNHNLGASWGQGRAECRVGNFGMEGALEGQAASWVQGYFDVDGDQDGARCAMGDVGDGSGGGGSGQSSQDLGHQDASSGCQSESVRADVEDGVWTYAQPEAQPVGRAVAVGVPNRDGGGIAAGQVGGPGIEGRWSPKGKQKERHPRDQHWEELFSELVQYRQVFGHVRVSQGSKTTRAKSNYLTRIHRLAQWVSRQRLKLRGSDISGERHDKLLRIGIASDQHEFTWEGSYQRLVAYHRKHGHTNVPQDYVGLDMEADNAGSSGGDQAPCHSLGAWVAMQRLSYKKGKMRKDRVIRLSLINFQWEMRNDWDTNYHNLVLLMQQSGRLTVPPKYKSLLRWVGMQRNLLWYGRISRDKAKLLEALGVNDSIHDDRWELMYSVACCFKQKFGHVLFAWDPSKSMFDTLAALPFDEETIRFVPKWLGQQRQLYKRGILKDFRRARLEQLGVEISSPLSSYWHARFNELVDFKRDHGTANVPRGWSQNPVLVRWVRVQRKAYKTGKIDPCRRGMLDEIGFCWGTSDAGDLYDSRLKRKTRVRNDKATSAATIMSDESTSIDRISGVATVSAASSSSEMFMAGRIGSASSSGGSSRDADHHVLTGDFFAEDANGLGEEERTGRGSQSVGRGACKEEHLRDGGGVQKGRGRSRTRGRD